MSVEALRLQPHDSWPVAAVRGDIDLVNVDELAARLERSVPNSSLGLVLDLSRVTYLDSTGLRLLFRLSRQLQDRQQALRVVVPPGAVIHSILLLAGFGAAVPLFPSLPRALANEPGEA